MRGSRAVLGLVPILLIAVTGCDAQDPVAAIAADRVSVRIDGPSTIIESGTYTWQAVTDGGGNDYEFVWEVVWLESDEAARRFDGRVLVLDVDIERGNIALSLSVRADGRTLTAGRIISTCGGPEFDEDRLIEECVRY